MGEKTVAELSLEEICSEERLHIRTAEGRYGVIVGSGVGLATITHIKTDVTI